jgi:hypothetical protein
MKKVMIIGSMLLLGMMMFNNVDAQNPRKSRADRLRGIQSKVDDNTEANIDALGGCVDSEDWMTGEGYGESDKNPQIAKNRAVEAAQNNLIQKMEAYVENVAVGLSYSETNERGSDEYASLLNNKFSQVVRGMRGRIKDCYSIPDQDDRGKFTCEYKVVVSLADVNKALKDAVENDAKLKNQTKMADFDKTADDVMSKMLSNQENMNNK